VTPTFGLEITVVALVGAAVGGLDRLWSATAGGFFVGFATAVLGDVVPSDGRVYVTSLTYLLVIVVLLARPEGMFAPLRRSTVERV
jgi:branched-chain amino acid transport system permease protein